MEGGKNSGEKSYAGSRECDPSQKGCPQVCLQLQSATVFGSVRENFTGARPVPLCEPSQYGWVWERPQAHHQ
jgi:hypothetical protein